MSQFGYQSDPFFDSNIDTVLVLFIRSMHSPKYQFNSGGNITCRNMKSRRSVDSLSISLYIYIYINVYMYDSIIWEGLGFKEP